MEVQYSKDNKIRGISITYNEEEGESIKQLKKFFNFQSQQIKVRTMESRFAYLPVNTIYYIESLDGRCLIYDKKKIYFALDRFQSYKENFMNYDFVQCNKTQIVNTNHIKMLEIYKDCQRIITLDNDEILLVSRRYKESIDMYKDRIDPFNTGI